MDTLERLIERKREILERILDVGDMRKGSVTEYFLNSRRADGNEVKYGPYFIYTYKDRGKTVSRRFSGPEMAERYRNEINQFRMFERLSSDLVEVSQQICDARRIEDEGKQGKKKLLRPSPRKSGGRSKG